MYLEKNCKLSLSIGFSMVYIFYLFYCIWKLQLFLNPPWLKGSRSPPLPRAGSHTSLGVLGTLPTGPSLASCSGPIFSSWVVTHAAQRWAEGGNKNSLKSFPPGPSEESHLCPSQGLVHIRGNHGGKLLSYHVTVHFKLVIDWTQTRLPREESFSGGLPRSG